MFKLAELVEALRCNGERTELRKAVNHVQLFVHQFGKAKADGVVLRRSFHHHRRELHFLRDLVRLFLNFE